MCHPIADTNCTEMNYTVMRFNINFSVILLSEILKLLVYFVGEVDVVLPFRISSMEFWKFGIFGI